MSLFISNFNVIQQAQNVGSINVKFFRHTPDERNVQASAISVEMSRRDDGVYCVSLVVDTIVVFFMAHMSIEGAEALLTALVEENQNGEWSWS